MIKPTKIKIISSLLATSFVLSAFMASVFAPTAHAQTQIVAYPTMEMHATYSVPIYDAAADITASTKSAIAGVGGVSFNTIGKMAMKVFIKVLVQKIVKWIKGGGKGPLFIENFGDVLLEAANQASGLYLEKLKATGLCQNLAPSLMLQIKAQTGPEVSMRCTLRDVINNIDGFSKNFNNGGWKAWLKVSMETQNNPYGAYLTNAEELQKYMDQKTQEAQLQTQVSKGFLGVRQCAQPDPNQPGTGCLRWEVKTPGSIINDELATVLGSEFRQLELAQEFDDVLVYIVQQGVGYFQGLLSDAGDSGIGGVNTPGGKVWPPPTNPAVFQQQRADLKDRLIVLYDNVINQGLYDDLLSTARKLYSDVVTNLGYLIDCPAMSDIGLKIDYRSKKQDAIGIVRDIDSKSAGNITKYKNNIMSLYNEVMKAPAKKIDDATMSDWNLRLNEYEGEFSQARNWFNEAKQARSSTCNDLENPPAPSTGDNQPKTKRNFACGYCSDLDGSGFSIPLPAYDCRMLSYTSLDSKNLLWNPKGFYAQHANSKAIIGFRKIVPKEVKFWYGIYNQALATSVDSSSQTADWGDIRDLLETWKPLWEYREAGGKSTLPVPIQIILDSLIPPMPPLPSLCDLDPLNISGDCGSSKQPPPVVNDIPVQPVCNMESVLSPRAGYVANIFQYGIPTANGTLFYYRQLDKAPYGDLIPLSEMAIFECDTTPPVCDGKTPWPKATQLSGGPDSGSGKASVDLPSGADTNGCVFTKEDKTLSSSEAQANYIDWDKGTNIPAGKIALVGYKSNGGASFYLTPATPPATPPDGSATAAQVRDAGKSGAKWSKENVGAGSSYDCLNYTGSTGNVWAVTNDSHTATGALSIWACDSKPKACGGADGPGGGNPPTGGQCTFSIPEGQACGVSCDCVSGLLCVNSVCHTKAYSDSCSSASMSCGPSNNNMPCCDPDKYQCKQNQYGNFCEPK